MIFVWAVLAGINAYAYKENDSSVSFGAMVACIILAFGQI